MKQWLCKKLKANYVFESSIVTPSIFIVIIFCFALMIHEFSDFVLVNQFVESELANNGIGVVESLNIDQNVNIDAPDGAKVLQSIMIHEGDYNYNININIEGASIDYSTKINYRRYRERSALIARERLKAIYK